MITFVKNLLDKLRNISPNNFCLNNLKVINDRTDQELYAEEHLILYHELMLLIYAQLEKAINRKRTITKNGLYIQVKAEQRHIKYCYSSGITDTQQRIQIEVDKKLDPYKLKCQVTVACAEIYIKILPL